MNHLSDLVDRWLSCVRSGITVNSTLLLWPDITVRATSFLRKEDSGHEVLACSYLSRVRGYCSGITGS